MNNPFFIWILKLYFQSFKNSLRVSSQFVMKSYVKKIFFSVFSETQKYIFSASNLHNHSHVKNFLEKDFL